MCAMKTSISQYSASKITKTLQGLNQKGKNFQKQDNLPFYKILLHIQNLFE